MKAFTAALLMLFFVVWPALAEERSQARVRKREQHVHQVLFNKYYQERKYKEALAEAETIIRINPYNAVAYSLKARVHVELSDCLSAIADLNKAIELAPFRPNFYLERGDMLVRVGKYEAAIKDYDEALKLNHPRPTTVITNKDLAEKMLSTSRRLEQIKAGGSKKKGL